MRIAATRSGIGSGIGAVTRRALRCALAAAAFVWAGAAGAMPVTLGGTDPLFFPMGGANTGFDATAVADYLADSSRSLFFGFDSQSSFLCAGNDGLTPDVTASPACAGHTSFDLSLSQDLQFTQDAPEFVHQNPQARGSTPSAGDPYIADSIWTVTNTSGAALPATVLLLTNVELSDYDGNELGRSYPNYETGFDANLLELVRYDAGGGPYFYGALSLPALAAGESAESMVRYVVNGPGDLPSNGSKIVMPPIGVLGVVVPEPASVLMLVAGLAALGVSRRRR